MLIRYAVMLEKRVKLKMSYQMYNTY